MPDDQLESLADDILANGLIHPIVLYQGRILDGRNRYLACLRARVEPVFVTYEGDEPELYANGLNYERRDLNAGTRAMGRSRLAQQMSARRRKLAGDVRKARVQRSLPIDNEDAKRVREQGIPELIAAMKAGDISASKAREIAELDEDEQRAVLEKAARPVDTRAEATPDDECWSERVAISPTSQENLRWALNQFRTQYKYRNPGVAAAVITEFQRVFPWL